MRNLWCAVCALGIALAGLATARADEQSDLKAVIDKALKAHGGADNITKYKAATSKVKGTFYGSGQEISFTGDYASQAPGQRANRIEAEVNGMKFAFAQVVNGDRGWKKTNDQVEELDKDTLAEEKERTYSDWLSSLAPLRDKEFKLSTLGESKIGKQTAVGVNVARKDHRDVKLFFDKASGLLLKKETRLKDIEGGREVNQETFYHDYKIVQGVQHAMKMEIKWDGKPYVEFEVTEIKPEEKLDESVFAKP